MPDKNPNFDDIPAFAFLKEFEEELGIKAGFFFRLLKEDDWSFIIKLHSFLEAAVTHMLIEALGKPELQDIIARFEISNLKTGKLAFTKSLALLDKDSQRFIQKLSEVRNKLVHDVSNVNIELKSFFSSAEEGDKKGFLKAFHWGHEKRKVVKYKLNNEEVYSLQEVLKCMTFDMLEIAPKLTIWLGSIIVLLQIYSTVLGKRLERMERELSIEIIDLMSNVINKEREATE